MTEVRIDIGGSRDEEPAWIGWTMLALVLFGVVVEYLL
jgi:hypothetical protein